MLFKMNKIKKINRKMQKKGQVGETLTWVAATLVIILMIVAFLFLVNILAKTKIPSFDISGSKVNDMAAEETLLAILSYKVNEKSVNDLIKAKSYSDASSAVNSALDNFASNGLACNFYAFEDGTTKIKVEKATKITKFSYDNGRVTLKC